MRYFKNVETLEELRKQYKELLKKYHPDNPNGSTKATQEVNAEYDNLFKVLKDRHEHKDALKALGFKWAREKKKWYFHTEAFRKRSHKKLSMDDIRNYYGSTEVQTEATKRLKEA